jgi:transposase
MTAYFAGLDLHQRYLTVCVLDRLGQVGRAQRRLVPTVEAVVQQFPGDGAVTVVLEATLQWAWFQERLTVLGYQVLVAHPQQPKLSSHARCKTDPIDARKLAELGRAGLVPAIWVPDAATRERRLRLRGRARLVRWRTRRKHRIHARLAEQNLAAPGTDLFSVVAGEVVRVRCDPTHATSRSRCSAYSSVRGSVRVVAGRRELRVAFLEHPVEEAKE